LAIAKRYLEKNPSLIKDEQAFYDGNIAPDLSSSKNTTHYSLPRIEGNLLSHMKNKVGIASVYRLPIDTDFEKGVFLHLLTDYVFYNFYFDKTAFKNYPPNKFTIDLYASYNYTNPALAEKYKISYESTSNGALLHSYITKLQISCPTIESGENLLTDFDKLCGFIEFMSGLNLEKVRKTQNIVL
jgi:hypothetical protein